MQFSDTDDIYEDDQSEQSNDDELIDDVDNAEEAELDEDDAEDAELDDADADEAELGDDDHEDDEFDDDEEDEDEVQPRGEAAAELEGLVQFIAERLVHDPAEIVVESEFRGGTIYISLRVPESEMGRVIGREGRTAKAIRTLVSIAGSRHNVHARLDIDG